MKRQTECEQLNCSTLKVLDQVLIILVEDGVGCSQCEAAAVVDWIGGLLSLVCTV
jgi:hypothetical protein